MKPAVFTVFRHAGTEILQYLVKESEFKALKVHSTPKKFENAASSVFTVRPTVHTEPKRKRSFSKKIFTPEEFKNAGVSFSCERRAY